MEYRHGPLLLDMFSLIMELLVFKMNILIEDSTRLEKMPVDRHSLLPAENRDRVLLVDRDNLVLEEYNNIFSA